MQHGHGRLHRLHQGPLHLGPGGRPAGVHDAVQGVTALPGQLQLAVGVAVEHRPHGDELVHPGRALVDQDPHRFGVAQPGTGRQRVGQVQVGGVGVVAAQHGGHAALGPAGGGLGQLALGEHPHAHPVGVGGPHGGGEAGHARPQDQEVQGWRAHQGAAAGGGDEDRGRAGLRPGPRPRGTGGGPACAGRPGRWRWPRRRWRWRCRRARSWGRSAPAPPARTRRS